MGSKQTAENSELWGKQNYAVPFWGMTLRLSGGKITPAGEFRGPRARGWSARESPRGQNLDFTPLQTGPVRGLKHGGKLGNEPHFFAQTEKFRIP